MTAVRRAIAVHGTVQGVGFRPFVHGLAGRHELAGFVRNVSGDVEIEVEGEGAEVERFVTELRRDAPPLAKIESVEVKPLAPRGEHVFRIEESSASPGAKARLVPPDAATCPECLRELLDPADRRYRYPFINCTHCGPRFTIIDDLPYDRARTSMARFTLCARCRSEYENPRDRRFHAEPIACPACGPTLTFRADAAARPSARGDAALAAAVKLLQAGEVLALKGLGGYQLACDATSE
ncbi:MAG TPA: acylphosphatase, partial [Planctomycetota bacterium]|nr:acylphosphatase [Planctomycetota bacterium]